MERNHDQQSSLCGCGAPANLIVDSAGNFYGATNYGGAHGYGTVYKLTPSGGGTWKETTLYSFPGGTNYWVPSFLVFDSAGNLYGTTAFGGSRGNGTVFELSPASNGSWVEKDLYIFKGSEDGGKPFGSLIIDEGGNLYGTTASGGAKGCSFGCGIVFELSPGTSGYWTETVLYRFTGASDGGAPAAGLIFDRAGNLYGTTQFGGKQSLGCGSNGCGTVFKLSPASGGGWTESVLYQFTGSGGDGVAPTATLVFDRAGNLYGTTQYGGARTYDFPGGCGTVFELSPSTGGGWNRSVLFPFNVQDTACFPVASVVVDGAGNLFGTTTSGSTGLGGIVFELSPLSGGDWNENVLHAFPINFLGDRDGNSPYAALILDQAGNLYGTTVAGGKAGGGTVFEITP